MSGSVDHMDTSIGFWPRKYRSLNWDLEPELDLCVGPERAHAFVTSKNYSANSSVPCGEWKHVSSKPMAVVSNN